VLPLLSGAREISPHLVSLHSPVCNPTASFRLECTMSWGSGDDRLSQVWLCRAIDFQDTYIAVKLFHQAFAPLPSYDADAIVDNSPYVSMTNLIFNEFGSYFLLEHRRGKEIPLSFGFYNVRHLYGEVNASIALFISEQFTLPSGEEVVGHVMEHVKGETLDEFLKRTSITEERLFQPVRQPSTILFYSDDLTAFI
jgi:hypothetical protein